MIVCFYQKLDLTAGLLMKFQFILAMIQRILILNEESQFTAPLIV